MNTLAVVALTGCGLCDPGRGCILARWLQKKAVDQEITVLSTEMPICSLRYMGCCRMNLAYDLHIHSCLSPCGDERYDPANIAGMAALKGLEAIAPPTIIPAATALLFWLPRLSTGSLQCRGWSSTLEEVHAVCLFPSLSQPWILMPMYAKLIKFPIMKLFLENSRSMMTRTTYSTEPNLLINATEISFDGLGTGPVLWRRDVPRMWIRRPV